MEWKWIVFNSAVFITAISVIALFFIIKKNEKKNVLDWGSAFATSALVGYVIVGFIF